MSNKGNWFRKYFWDTLVVKKLLKDRWIITLGVGGIGASVIPDFLPLQHLSRILNAIVYGVFFVFIARFVDIVLTIRTDVKKTLDDFQEKIGMTYYKGFYTLLTNSSKNFQTMEESLKTATGESPLRGVLLDFIVNSLASIGKNGFTMVDASVTDYVMYIMQVVPKSKQITMTCAVRPYWFVVDETQGVTLPPYITSSNKYGKGEHLKAFRKDLPIAATRYLVVDEHMLAEMILTAYIDKLVFEKNHSNCPICRQLSEPCPVHNNRIKLSDSIDDIPEIFWFKKNVNDERGVTLIYTLIGYERRRMHAKLDDRVYISNPLPQMDIRFEFTNLERGILRIRWGNQAISLALITTFNTKINPINGNADSVEGYTFYESFSDTIDTIKEELKLSMQKYLELLEREVNNHFNPTNIENISSSVSPIIRKLLANGSDAFKSTIKDVISNLKNDLGNKNLSDIYNTLIQFYRQNGVAKVAYIVTYDPANPKYPVRVASWKFNWDGDGNDKEGILNAPD